MKLPKFISSIKSRSSSAASSPASSPRLTSPAISGPFNFLSPKSSLSPKSPSHFKSLFERKKNPTQHGTPSPPRRKECFSEISSHSPRSPLHTGGIGSSPFEGVSASFLRELELVFRHFDTNGDGKISASELGTVLRSVGDCLSDDDAILMMQEVDADGDGHINLQEFIDLNTRSLDATGEIESLDELKAVFHIFDLDRNGFITPDELYSVMTRLGDKQCTMEDCCKMIKGVDKNGDGYVDFEEFKIMMRNTCLAPPRISEQVVVTASTGLNVS